MSSRSNRVRRLVVGAWRWLRRATGDDAYERYVEHQAKAHPDAALLSRVAFFDETQRRKWQGVSRCC
jgi:uncharacterized short protein YbdD (DUF466 family)